MNDNLVLLAGLVAASLGATAYGQAAQSGEDAADVSSAGLEEIIVTAQKRSERLQDVPLAVTAIGAEALANREINDTNSLTRVAPSLSFQQGNNPTNSSFRIRGIGTSLFGVGFEPSVSVVVDGVVMARSGQSFADLNDVERIEVLRGPQGTLFGKNSTAGVINVITERPDDVFGGKLEATIAEDNEYRVRGTVTGPLGDSLRARFTGYYNDVGGQFDNVVTGRDWGGNEGYGGRGKLEWDATQDLNLLLIADYRKLESDCCRPLLIDAVNPVLAALYAPVVGSPDNRQVAENNPTFSTSEQTTFSLQSDWDLGFATITSISAFQNFKIANNVDADGYDTTTTRYTGGSNGIFFAQYDINGGTLDLDNFTQELRIGSNGDGPFTYVAGVYYTAVDIERAFQRRRGYCAAGTPALIGQSCTPTSYQSQEYYATVTNDSVSLFGQAEWEFIDRWKLIAGLRGQHDKIDVTGVRSGGPMAQYPTDVVWPGGTAVNGTDSASDDAVSGKAGIQFEISRSAQVYATYSRGFKSQGFGSEITTDFGNQAVVDPEKVNGYEVGFKGTSADGRYSMALAVFLQDYTDLQIQTTVFDPATGPVARTTNAGSSTSKGVELETMLQPTDSFSVNMSVAYTEATIDIDGFNCPLTLVAAAANNIVNLDTTAAPINQCYRPRFTNSAGSIVTVSAATPLINLRDAQLPMAPRWRAGLSPRYEFDLGATGLVATLQADVNYQSDVSMGQSDPLLEQDAYTIVDVSAGVKTGDDRYSVRLFVRNLFDETYYSDLAHNNGLADAANPFDLFAQIPKDADRYFGATFGVRF